MNAKTFLERAFLSRPASLTALILLVVAGAHAQVTNCASQPAGLVSWWRAELDSNDAVGGHNGTAHAGVTFTTGEVGQAFSFDGTTNGYIEVPHTPELELTNELTIEFWVKRQRLTFPGSPYADYVVEKGGDYTGGLNNYSAALHNPQYNYCLHFVFAEGWRGGGSIADTNTWHHCAITARNGDVDPALYIDGVSQPVVYSEGASTINLYPSTRPLHIGAQLDPNTGWFYYSQVLVDELSIYNRVLSAAEIQAIYNAGSAGKCLQPPPPSPTIITQPADTTVNAGSNAIFNVGVSGTSPLYYQWYFGATPLANGTSQSLSLPSVTPEQAGTYFVVVTNAYGTATSSNATLTVLTIPPTITQQPPSTNVFVGANIGLMVLASGSPTLTYQWQKDGAPLAGATSSIYRILNARVTNSGAYSVVITNPYGSVTSSNATVTVLVPPPCTPPPPGLVSWWRGETNQLDSWDSNDGVGVSLGTVETYVQGKVGLAFLNPSVVVPDSFSLHITNALTLQGWVNPTVLSGFTPYTIISKFDSPTLQGTGNQSSFWFGTTNNGLLYFQVSGTGSQRTNVFLMGPVLPTNQWSFVVSTYDGAALRLYVNGALVAQRAYSGGIFPGNQNLGIGGVPQSTTTTLTSYLFRGSIDEVCIYNRALTDSEIQDIYNADISGMCLQPPMIVNQPQTQAIPLGEDVMFSVGVQGNRPLRYQWYFNTRALQNATNSSLVLERIRTNQAGAYSVAVTNSVGFATSAIASLTLLPAPPCNHAPDGMISWWPANNSPIDVVGTNNAVLGGATYVTGKVNQAFALLPNLPEPPDGWIQVANSPSLNFGSNADFSIEAWVKAFFVSSRPDLLPSQGMVIVQKRGSAPHPGPGYALTLYEGRLAFWLSSSATVTTQPPVVSSGPDLRDSMFHHLAVTLQRAATNGGRLYVDGQLVQTFSATSTLQRGSLSNSLPLYIASTFGQSTDGSLSGYVDELAIYNRALSADEIMAIRTAGAAGKCDHPPVATTFLTKGLQDEVLSIPTYRFLLFSYDPDGDPLSLFSVASPSQGGRPVVLGTNQVTYTPATGYLGQDNFTYTISDGHGGRTRAMALVLIEPRMVAAATVIAPSPPGPGGLQLGFSGYPERTYTVQRADSIEGPWTDLGTATTDADGLANFTDSNPPPVCAYYRAVYRSVALPLGEAQHSTTTD